MNQVNDLIFKELVKRGHSVSNGKRVWDISDSKLWYLTPKLSEGFLELEKYEPYRMKVVDTEFDLISKSGKSLFRFVKNKKFNLIDLGCGNGRKAEEIIKILPKDNKVRYCPVDISSFFIKNATDRVNSVNSESVESIKSFQSDFEDLDDVIGSLRNSDYQENMILLLGETISHYDVNDLLYKISESMMKGDVIVIGNGYRVGERFTALDKYKDALFDKWFGEIMRGLGFSDSEVQYSPRFANDRLEFFYSVKQDKTIEFNGKKVEFKKGDEVIIGSQYKYFENEWIEFCKMYFCDVQVIKDEKKEYAFFVCIK